MNKIKQYFFYKDGEFSWWKTIQNILLIYVVSYLIGLYYDLFYNPSATRIFGLLGLRFASNVNGNIMLHSDICNFHLKFILCLF